MDKIYSKDFLNILEQSKKEAMRLRSTVVMPEHLFLGIIMNSDNNAIKLLQKSMVPIEKLKEYIEAELMDVMVPAEDEKMYDQHIYPISPSTGTFINMASIEARRHNSPKINSEHLLLAFLHDPAHGYVYRILDNMNIKYQNIEQLIRPQDSQSQSIPQEEDYTQSIEMGADFTEENGDAEEDDLSYLSGKSRSGQGETRSKTAAKRGGDTPVLDKFGKDITKQAEEGKLDPVVGREKEIERLAQILSRRKKNNPVLIGEPGVGKSAIVEGLALRIIERKVARVLFDKRVVTLDMASVVAGTKYRGQFEERIKALIDEVSKNKDVILFIDEIHTIVGAGSATGSMDAANLLKPALARGEIQCIGATTLDEYRKNIEKDGALERRFQKVMVEPTTVDETLQILNNIKDKYEEHHGVTYTPEAIEACVRLTDRFVSDRYFPDKAIDALDEAGSRVHISNVVVPKEIEKIEEQIRKAQEDKIKAVQSQDYESAANFRDLQERLTTHLEEEKEKWEKQLAQHREIVDENKVAEVVAMMTGVPTQRIAQAEGIRLLNMDNELKSEIIGQDNAISKITKSIRRNRVGLKDPNRPIGTFMFLGPTGVGKTYLAKKLAEFLFNSSDALIRVDMSEYMEKFTVSRLVGAPPGYVGYEEGGQLTEKVRRHPYSVVLLDEIEKAHSDVFNMLLQVMDEGRLTDSLGRKVDFKNTIIIMTSNIGSREVKDFNGGIGFSTADSDKTYSENLVRKALNRHFSPEFLNRVDDIIMFEQLDKDSIKKIVEIELKSFYKRVEDLGFKLEIADAVKDYLADKGYDKNFGARPLKRAIQNSLEDVLAEFLLQEKAKPGDTVTVHLDDSGKDVIAEVANVPTEEKIATK